MAEEPQESIEHIWHEYKHTGDRELRNRLMEYYWPLVRYTAERVAAKLPSEVDVDDLVSAGVFGLIDAIEAFDVHRGVKFETYCSPRIRGAILDELRTMDWVPRLVRSRAHKLESATKVLRAELGRMPTEEEIAARLGLKKADMDKVLKDSNAVSLVSLSRKYHDEDSSRELQEIDVVQDEESTDPLGELQKHDLREAILNRLTQTERLIVVLYYYEQMTMKEIGATLDLSESRVSQMHSSIVARLTQLLEQRQGTSNQTRQRDHGALHPQQDPVP